jgi:DME family drug/metabolite transporter
MLAWLGLVATAGTYLLFARGLTRLPAATVSTLNLAEPLTAATLGLLVLGERPGARAAVGALILLTGLALAALRPTQEAPTRRSRGRRPQGILKINVPSLYIDALRLMS